MQFLIIEWLKFFPALVLLFTPLGLFYSSKKTGYRNISDDGDVHWLRVLTHGGHAIDLVRAALGTWLVLDSLHQVPSPHGLAKYAALLTQGFIYILAVWVQTGSCRRPDSINAPFAFVTGLLLAGISPFVALFALAVAILFAIGTRSPALFFPVVALAHLGIGIWFNGAGSVLRLGFGPFAAMIPLLWSMMFHRDLVITYRAGRAKQGDQLDRMR